MFEMLWFYVKLYDILAWAGVVAVGAALLAVLLALVGLIVCMFLGTGR